MARSRSGLAMASKPENSRPVEAHGTLCLDTPGGRSLNLVAEGDTLRLELPGWSDSRSLLPRSLRGRARAVRFVADQLATHELALSLETDGRPVVRLGHDTPPSWLARLLGLGSINLRLSALRLLFSR
ncbi:MAG: hypothetical protein QNJ23_03500 [Woeseiaceae bacterium]|nr:hypothetical protein [Woeseiaceae bacterium]